MMKFRQVIKNLAGLVKNKPKLYFIHIGKTGGSAIVAALNGHTHKHIYNIKFNGHRTKLTDVPEGNKLFFCVRDPIDRFVSGFYSRQRQGRPKYNSPWRKEEKAAFELFKTPNELALSLSSNNVTRKAQAEFAMQSISHVKTSYWDWFIDESYLKHRIPDILFICNQHHLKEDFNHLKNILGVPEHVELPDKYSFNAHANPKGLDRELEDQAKENLKLWYAADYTFIALVKEIKLSS